MDIHIQIFMRIYVFIFGLIPVCVLGRSYGDYISYDVAKFFSKVAGHIYILISAEWEFSCSTFLPVHSIVSLLNFSYLMFSGIYWVIKAPNLQLSPTVLSLKSRFLWSLPDFPSCCMSFFPGISNLAVCWLGIWTDRVSSLKFQLFLPTLNSVLWCLG